MVIHPVQVDWNKEVSDKVNISEAEKVLEIIQTLKNDDRYKDRSIGVLTFFNLQATHIRKILEEAGYTDDNGVKVSVIEGIQGDEKDIVIYSFVITSPDQKKRYISLAGEGGEINKDITAGRVNVAFSRAKMQVHCVTSLPLEKFPEGIWIDRFLKYVAKHGEIHTHSKEPNPFDSHFEEDFYYFARFYLENKSYLIHNQVKSCGFKIDFVISNPKNGNKIAIECDGPTHFKDEIDEEFGIYVENDIERQNILENAGYRDCFYRIKYSDWIKKDFDRSRVMKDIEQRLS
jgi:very-short-patch-repair endonuclease